MSYIRNLAALAISAASLMGPMGAASAAPLYNVHSGPGYNYPIVYQLGSNTTLQITCYTNDAAGNRWYQLSDGNYIISSNVVNPGNYTMCAGRGMF